MVGIFLHRVIPVFQTIMSMSRTTAYGRSGMHNIQRFISRNPRSWVLILTNIFTYIWSKDCDSYIWHVSHLNSNWAAANSQSCDTWTEILFSEMYVKYYLLLLQMLSDFTYKEWKSCVIWQNIVSPRCSLKSYIYFFFQELLGFDAFINSDLY